jgi:hypothetical protein
MNLTLLDNVLWATSLLANVALFLVLMVRGGRRQFPVFTSLFAFEALNTVALYLIYRLGSHHAYSQAYWTFAFIDFGFQLALIYEISRTVLRPTGTWVRDARRDFLLWSGIAIVVALAAAGMITPPEGSIMSKLEVRGTLFTSLMTCELFLAMIMAANRLGLQWQSHIMAIGQGLTVWALVALIGDLAHIIYGWNRDFIILDHIRMFSYLGAVTYWIVTFLRPERARNPISSEMERYLVAVHKSVQYDLESLSAAKKHSL